MPDEPLVFLDTSALFAGIWSAAGGGRAILELGEAGAVQLRVCSQVLREIEDAFRRKAPDQLGALATLLHQAQLRTIDDGEAHDVDAAFRLTGHQADAIVLEAAMRCEADYLVTLDRRHLLGLRERPEIAPLQVGTPGDFLAWYRSSLPGCSVR